MEIKGSDLELILDKEYQGPDIHQLAGSIPQITDAAINVRWGGTRDELRALRQFPGRRFKLYIAEPHVMDRALAIFGKPLGISQGIRERAKLVLCDAKAYDWRNFIKQTPGTSPKYALLQLAADAVRRGSKPVLAGVLGSLLLNGAAAEDADVLLRLKSTRMR
jgi:hypothetical protein